MALTYTTYEDNNGNGVGIGGGDTTTTSRSFTAGELVVVLWVAEGQYPGNGTVSCTNSGTAQTWNDLGSAVYTTDYCYLRGWWCVMDTTQSMTITCASTNIQDGVSAVVYTLVHAGQDGTTPVPAGKVSSGTDADGDVSVSITPTATGSCLWLLTGDWNNDTDTYTAGANCTKVDNYVYSGSFSVALFRPTTQPRADASAFTISETDTTGKISYIAFEVVAAASSFVPRSMLLGVG